MESLAGRQSDWSVSLSSGGRLNIDDATLVHQDGTLSFTRVEARGPRSLDLEVAFVGAGKWEAVFDRIDSNTVLDRVGE